MATSVNNKSNIRQNAKEFYKNRENIARKWLDQYGNVTQDNVYQQNRTCLSEIFNMLDVVMENCIDEFRHSHTMLAIEAGEKATTYTFQGDDGQDVCFIIPTTFALRVRALRAIGYPISDELLYETRILRNETTHGNQTVVLQHIKLGYDETMKAMLSMGDTLILLDMLDPSLRAPTYEMMRVREGDMLRNGAYIIGPLIGEGGMSRVYKASQKRTGLELAIKEMKPGKYSEEMLRREGDILLHLHHNQIPQVHDTFFENDTYYIVMDFVEGNTLNRFLKENELGDEARAEIVKGLLDVLNYLHGSNVDLVFSDLSPENIIVDSSAKPHLIDFGTAVRLNEKQNLSAGTLGYAAPEVLSGGALDERTDIYSFGYVLRFLYTGLSPQEEKEKPTEELVSDSSIVGVINKCTEVNPEMRYGTVKELTEAMYPGGLSKDSYVSRKVFRGVIAAAGILLCGALIWAGVSRRRVQKDMEVLEKQAQEAGETIQTAQKLQKERQGVDVKTYGYISMEGAGVNADEVIIWHDENLEKAIRENTLITKGDICYGDIWDCRRFVLTNYEIEDISDLSKLVNLVGLDLSGNNITDISPLEHLTELEELFLMGNKIKDILPLSKLENLKALDLSYNRIMDISPLSKLEKMEALDLSYNRIMDISPLKNLTGLEKLSLVNTQIKDIYPLNDLKEIKSIALSDNQIKDISPLENLERLEVILLDKNQIQDISPLENLTGLKFIGLSDNQIKDISPLENLGILKTIVLARNQIQDISPLEKLTSLVYIELSDNQIKDISPLGALTNLKYLQLDTNQIKDISPIGKLDKLEYLTLDDNPLEDSPLLSNLQELGVLKTTEEPIPDITINDLM